MRLSEILTVVKYYYFLPSSFFLLISCLVFYTRACMHTHTHAHTETGSEKFCGVKVKFPFFFL